jgi:hypothetical protein
MGSLNGAEAQLKKQMQRDRPIVTGAFLLCAKR